MNTEEDARDVRLAEQEIARQGFDEKNRLIDRLQARIELLENMLNRVTANAGAYPRPMLQPVTITRQSPRRWSVR